MKKKKLGVLGAVVLLSCVAIFIFALSARGSDSRLTEKQINDLRAEYPICYGTPPTAEMMIPTFDQVIERSNTFIYAKVVGEVSYYYVNASTGNEALDKKRVENGLSNTYEFYEYTLEVISDTQGMLENKSQITIAANSDFENYHPVLKDGMKVVVPVKQNNQNENNSRYYYGKEGFFYVTEDGYVLSAFDEDDPLIFYNTKIDKKSGIKVDSLMKQLKQKKDDMLKSAAVTDEASE